MIICKFLQFAIPKGVNAVSDFNLTINASGLQQNQSWEVPQIKDLKLAIPEHYTFAASSRSFVSLGILSNYLTLATLNKSALFSSTYKTSFNTLPHCLP